MIGDILKRKMQPLKDAEDLIFRRWVVSGVMLLGAGALVVMIWLAVAQQWFSGGMVFGLLLAASLLVMVTVTLKKQKPLNFKKLADRIEEEHPELQQALLTAVEQKPGPDGKLGYLQERVIEEAVDHALENDWLRTVYRPQLLVAAWVQGFAIFNMLIMFIGLLVFANKIQSSTDGIDDGVAPLADFKILVTPGDAEVERGQRLIVEVAFDGRIPSGAEIVVTNADEKGQEMGRVPMKQGLDDGMFSGLITKIDRDVRYRIEFQGDRSENFNVTTYVHPELEQADVLITPPEYAGQKQKEMKNVRKVSALEGSELAFSLQVNKAIVAAELFGEDETVIPLVPSKEDATILEAAFTPTKSQRFRVHLVDSDERSNKEPPWLKVTVKKNTPPKLELVFPKRDLAVSVVQEMPVEAKVFDDLGVTGTGAVFIVGDEEKEVSLSNTLLVGGKKHALKALLAIEEMGVKPRDLITYYLWAEDRDAKGGVRRIMSDMFFAEVRHFEDIFREAEAMSSKSPPKPGESDKLVDLQKKVINASWKLVRRAGGGEDFEELKIDVDVVKQSQGIVAEKVDQALEKVKDQKIRSYLESAKTKMLQAVDELGGVLEEEKGEGISKQMKTSRGAYEDLLLAQGREHQVTRAQKPQPSGGGKQKMESQLMQLELKQQEKRYEKASEAKDQPAKTEEQKENLAVLNRLKELAHRQEALAKKIKELENALEKASSDAEKAELKKELKRLQEEQEQLLRDLDDVTERMEKPENLENMAEEKKKLEETREKVREASEELKKENLADAANAATRAQRELDEVKEDFRKKTSRRFTEEMRAVRNQARDLAEKQKEVGEKLEQAGSEAVDNKDPFKNQESMLENLQLGRELDEQRKDLGKLLDEMRRISEESDGSEDLLSTALYEAVRKAQTQGVDEALEEARDLGRIGRSDLAQESEARAARGIDDLKKNVEKAAGKVLGNEGDALRMARAELDDLLRQVEEEKQGLNKEDSENKGGNGEKMDLAMNDAGKKKAGEKEASEGQKAEETSQARKQKGGKNGEEKKGASGEKPGSEGEVGKKEKAGEGKGKKSEEGKPGGKGEGKEDGKSEQAGSKQGEGQGKEGKPGSKPGEGGAKGKMAGQQPGSKPGEGKAGEGKPGGESDAKGEGKAEGSGKGSGKGKGKSQLAQQGQGQKPGGQPSGQPSGQKGQRPGGAGTAGGRQAGVGQSHGGGDDRRRGGVVDGEQGAAPLFFERAVEEEPTGPLTGKDYEEWTDRLRDVEEALDDPKLRNEVAKVLDNARAMRIDHHRNNLPPQANAIDKKIIAPLVELRDQVAEQLARMDKKNPLAPIDRDPVPPEYKALVKKYYQELGGGR